jgi:threonylcarbamoyladenosine tRNA methylthiotransferase MtaB
VRRAVDAGYREIAVTGVHLGSYGRDLRNGTTLTSLVRQLADWPDDVLFRVSSLEPMDCTPEIVAAIARSPRIAPHFHLPLQHGSDTILTADIRAQLPDASIGTDIIVGFPGETDAQFARMVDLIESLPLTYLHVFPYSDRPGTVASRLSAKVDGNDIRGRGRTIRRIAEQKSEEFRRSQVGRTMKALTVDDGSSVVTGNYLKIRISEPRPRNTWVAVKVESAEPLLGRALPY